MENEAVLIVVGSPKNDLVQLMERKGNILVVDSLQEGLGKRMYELMNESGLFVGQTARLNFNELILRNNVVDYPNNLGEGISSGMEEYLLLRESISMKKHYQSISPRKSVYRGKIRGGQR